RLVRGESASDRFLQLTRDGRWTWVEADYVPVREAEMCVQRIISIVRDVNDGVLRSQAESSFTQAIDRSMAVIEFDLNGQVVNANANFLKVVGYGLEEVRGQHHRLFCKPSEAQSEAYRSFWAALNRGEYMGGLFERVAKRRATLWLQATYNPLYDAQGHFYGVVKFATACTA
ncbi:PAS domain-containing protein, partial [Pseudomonas brassicacearum]|uniref:PAS domain-containing protein n=1 Tax=Pseudomonas brassicacearum TaxID=930166 RepID=UPI000F49D020